MQFQCLIQSYFDSFNSLFNYNSFYNSFNPDPSKQAQEVIFSRKLEKSVYPPLHFNNIAVTQSTTQKHLGMLLDVKLDFQGHLKNIYSKVNKTIGLLCNFIILYLDCLY